jgi:hypothetical protein
VVGVCPTEQSLSGDIEAEVCVVGAGIAELRPDLRAFLASGRQELHFDI